MWSELLQLCKGENNRRVLQVQSVQSCLRCSSDVRCSQNDLKQTSDSTSFRIFVNDGLCALRRDCFTPTNISGVPPTSSSFCGFHLFRWRLRTAQRLAKVWLIRENWCLWVYKSWYLTLACVFPCLRRVWCDVMRALFPSTSLAQQTVH